MDVNFNGTHTSFTTAYIAKSIEGMITSTDSFQGTIIIDFNVDLSEKWDRQGGVPQIHISN